VPAKILAVLGPLAVAAILTTTVGNPSNVSKQSNYNGEGTIAVNPTDGTKLFAGFNNTSTGNQWARSTNSGATWSLAGNGIGSSCCDNVAEWDRFGNLYLTNINGALNAVPLYLSTDNGANFSLLTTIGTGSVDQPTLKAGPNTLWEVWDVSSGIAARGATISGLGAGNIGAFSSTQIIPNSGNCQFGDVAVSPAGAVVDVCQNDTQIKAFTDADGLGPNGFTGPVIASTTNVDRFDSITPQPNRTIDAEANLAYDLSNGPHAGRLYLVYTDETPDESNNTDIFLRHSDNDGATWSAPVKVNDDNTNEAQFFPVVTVDPTTGNVFVSFLDCRNDPNNLKTEYWGAISKDGGATFEQNVKLSQGQSAAANDGNPNEYGDYSGNDYHGGKGYAIWPDNSNSTGDNPDGANNHFDMYAGNLDTGGNDTTPPETTIDNHPSDPTQSTSASFTFHADETATFECKLDAGSFASCTSPQNYNSLSVGSHTFQVRATDTSNNTDPTPASFTWTIQADTTPPETTIDNHPSDPTQSTSASFTFHADETATFECKLDAGSFASCTSPQDYNGLSAGSHTFQVRATDTSNNTDPTPASFTWTVTPDTTPPQTTIDSGPPNPTKSTSATFVFHADEPSTFECKIDSSPFIACTSPLALNNLPKRSHLFQVRATDAAANTDPTPAQYGWTNGSVPKISLTGTPHNPTNQVNATFTFLSTNDPGATFKCSLDGAMLADCTSPQMYLGLGAGAHTFMVNAFDAAGRHGKKPKSFSWTVDLTPPDTGIKTHPTDPTTKTSAKFGLTSTEKKSTFECQLDGGGFGPCPKKGYVGLAPGPHTFMGRAIDPAGNVDPSPVSFTWMIQ
jgi:hypothetical protein